MFYFIIIILLIIALTDLMMGYYLKDKLLVSLSASIHLIADLSPSIRPRWYIALWNPSTHSTFSCASCISFINFLTMKSWSIIVSLKISFLVHTNYIMSLFLGSFLLSNPNNISNMEILNITIYPFTVYQFLSWSFLKIFNVDHVASFQF